MSENTTNRKFATGGISVQIINGYALSDPVLFVHRNPDGSEKLHARVNVRANTGGEGDTEYKSDVVLDYWNGKAIWACNNIQVGSRVNGEGRLQSWLKPTGKVNPDGSPQYEMINTVRMDTNYPSGPTMKQIAKTAQKAIDSAKGTGLLPPQTTLTGEFIAGFFKGTYQEFSWDTINKTGKIGNARVWDKARNGYVTPSEQPAPATTTGTTANAGVDVDAMMKKMAEMEARLAAFQNSTGPELSEVKEPEVMENSADAVEVDPMAGL